MEFIQAIDTAWLIAGIAGFIVAQWLGLRNLIIRQGYKHSHAIEEASRNMVDATEENRRIAENAVQAFNGYKQSSDNYWRDVIDRMDKRMERLEEEDRQHREDHIKIIESLSNLTQELRDQRNNR